MNKKTIAGLRAALWFLVKLNILAVPLYLAVYFNYSIPAFQDAWALALGQSLQSLGYEAAVEGHIIGVISDGTINQIELSWDSTGWKSLYALSALVFASGVGTVRGKLRFLTFGLPLVALVNLVRILTTSVVALEAGQAAFELVHMFLWGALMVAFVLAAWYFLFFKEKR